MKWETEQEAIVGNILQSEQQFPTTTYGSAMVITQ